MMFKFCLFSVAMFTNKLKLKRIRRYHNSVRGIIVSI